MPHHRSVRRSRAIRRACTTTIALIVVFAAITIFPPLREAHVLAGTSYASTVLGDGPVSYWRLGEQTGTTAADSGNGGNNGTYNGGSTLGVAGAIVGDTDTAVKLNGSTGYVGVPDNANLDITGDMTLEMWAKPGALNGTTQTVLQKGTSSNVAGPGWQYRMSINSANRWKGILFVGNSSFEIIDTIDTLSATRWDYLVLVRSGTTQTLYVNGQAVGSVSISGPTNATTGMLAFGRAGSYSNYYLNGNVDEVAIYNQALTTAQIQSHLTAATSGSPGPTPTPSATVSVTPT